MARMLRHKETGELFVYTDLLSKLSELEPVFEDPVAAVIAEEKAKIKDEAATGIQADEESLEAALAAPTKKKPFGRK